MRVIMGRQWRVSRLIVFQAPCQMGWLVRSPVFVCDTHPPTFTHTPPPALLHRWLHWETPAAIEAVWLTHIHTLASMHTRAPAPPPPEPDPFGSEKQMATSAFIWVMGTNVHLFIPQKARSCLGRQRCVGVVFQRKTWKPKREQAARGRGPPARVEPGAIGEL